MKVNIRLGPSGHECYVTDAANGYKFHPTKLELVVEANSVPLLRMDFEVDDVNLEGENIDTELGLATMLAGKQWAKDNGFKLVPDDDKLKVELGKDVKDAPL